MKILIIGATGETGRLLVESCLSNGHELTALVRSPNRLSNSKKINLIQGDVINYDKVKKSVEGQDLVICALGAPQGQQVGHARSIGTQNLVKAMISENVPRLITISTIGVGQSRENMSLVSKLLYPLVVGKQRLDEAQKQESIIMNSPLDWTIVRPPKLVSLNKKQDFRVGETLATRFIDTLERNTLSLFIVSQLQHNDHIGKAITLVDK